MAAGRRTPSPLERAAGPISSLPQIECDTLVTRELPQSKSVQNSCRVTSRIGLFCLTALVSLTSEAWAQTQVLEPMVIAQERSEADPSMLPVDRLSFDYASLSNAPELTIDDVLRDDAAFSLFRRTSSLISNPTSQGVSLRGIGPSGASRSLVLLDGVPLNDPFGGWVQWSQVPSLILRRVDIDHGGGSGAWGNQALAGTIQLATRPSGSIMKIA